MEEKMKNFGNFFKQRRMALGLTLREFCNKYNLDPGNISKLERGKMHPPKEEKLEEYAQFLQLQKDSDEWYEFFELAAIDLKKMPQEFSNPEIAEKLPLLFRTVRGKKLSGDKLDELIKLIGEE